jgi:glycosyltransferase 2 family protein
MTQRTRKRVRVAIEVALIAALFVLFIRLLDWAQFRRYLLAITPRIVASVLAIHLVLHALGALQWWLILREAGLSLSYPRVFRARLSGYAITYLTPSMYFGGEPVRAMLLKDGSATYKKIAATIVLDKSIELFTKLPLIVVGFAFVVLLLRVELPFLLLAGAIIAAFGALFAFVSAHLFGGGGFIRRLAKGILRPLVRVRPRWAVRALRVATEFEHEVALIIRRRWVFYLAVAVGVLYSAMEVFQTWYVLGVLGHASLVHPFVIYATIVVQGLVSILPGNLGGMEGVHLFIFTVIGIGSAPSLIYTMILRIGQMSWVFLGLVNLFFSRLFGAAARRAAAEKGGAGGGSRRAGGAGG